MKVCSRCLYHEHHPLNILFDDEGVCSGCRVHEEKDILDWDSRGKLLDRILSNYRNESGNNYDCIIPVSGARDSHFIVHTVKNIYGMNPLLVTYNKHYNTALGARNLANLRIVFNCDIITETIDPETIRKITRATLRRLGSIYWHCLAGQTVLPVQLAVKFKIPLIIWGAHQGLDQVGMFSHTDEVEMTRKYRKEHDLMGYEAEDLLSDLDELGPGDIKAFTYPDDKELEQVGVRGIYLNNYIRWDSKQQHEKMIAMYDYETCDQNRTFDTYNDIDCFNYSDVHDYLKFVKHGYGKVTDHACREIRLRRMTREQALELVNEFSRREPRNLELFLDWLRITKNSFNYIVDQHRNPSFWRRKADWEWEFMKDVLLSEDSRNIDAARLPLNQSNRTFLLTPPKVSSDNSDKYVLIGKGRNI